MKESKPASADMTTATPSGGNKKEPTKHQQHQVTKRKN